MKLHYLAPSHFCEKARAILAFKNIPFTLVNVPYNNHVGVIKVSGQDYVPYIEVPGEKGVLWPDVAEWAEARAPKPTLYPGDDPKGTRARSRLVENWAHNVVEEAIWKYVVSDTPAQFKDEVERWVFTEFQERKRGPLEGMAARKNEFLVGATETLMLADDLLGNKDFLFGPAPSLADFALYGAMHPLKFTGNPIPAKCEGLNAWHKRVDALATVQK